MRQIPPAFTLMPLQSRLINATEGFRLEVRSGCLWLTRPGDAVDRFLVAGSTIELHENHVLIQSDRQPGGAPVVPAAYVLVSLATPVMPRSRWLRPRWTSRLVVAPQGMNAIK
ncbi:MAG: DUF2917 domain-containing protein [Rhodoferax sp.]|uniref:DUF2917 domain-containing protein n=1 Tax=Rhodoferax sp. TaxID=50421 RepID=UPI002638AF7B|nr:DUF2917 domain-containing protein [Rhodoferax sp.]MDD2879938.1 DUF2917 domain-containing protein [Rhodoferax sp.]